MNIENIDKAIAIMKRAGNLDMTCFQGELHNGVLTHESELHSCGTAACFAGWVAVSPEFRADGGTVSNEGAPILDGAVGEDAIAKWLDITPDTASALIYPEPAMYPDAVDSDDPSGECDWDQIEAEDVVNALERVKDGQVFVP